LIADLEQKRAEGVAPLDIINGPLMGGMAEVGRLFNANELIVAEVLQSAEAMKAAVNHLEQFMEKADTAKRGKVVLATVKGDVHDIGKNLVEIILKNNGFDVVNLGIKVPPEDLIKAFQAHQPDAIGLSGLLVKSAQQMVTTANDLKDAGIDVPLLVGGAALSAKFTQQKIAPSYGGVVCYAKDAMTGLRLMNELMDPTTRERVLSEHVISGNGTSVTTTVKLAEKPAVKRSAKVRTDLPIPSVEYLERKVRLVPDLREAWSYINPYMLPRTDHIRALAYEEWPRAVFRFDSLNARVNRPVRFRWPDARLLPLHHVRQSVNMLFRGAAAAAYDIQPAVIGELLELRGQCGRRLQILAFFIRQAGIRITGHKFMGQRAQRSNVVGHEFRPGGAVHAKRQRMSVPQRSPHCFHRLSRQHCAHRFNRYGHDEGNWCANFMREPPNRKQCGFNVSRILASLDE
jgi:methanogenic corrinoid protein MtbC1